MKLDYGALAKKLEFKWIDAKKPFYWGKFLVMYLVEEERCLVIAGNFEWHKDILKAWRNEDGASIAVGAGRFAHPTKIIEWRSEGLSVDTPVELQRPLQTLFDAKIDLIVERWQK